MEGKKFSGKGLQSCTQYVYSHVLALNGWWRFWCEIFEVYCDSNEYLLSVIILLGKCTLYIQLTECMNNSFTGDYEDMNKKQLLCVVNNLEKVWDTCVYVVAKE